MNKTEFFETVKAFESDCVALKVSLEAEDRVSCEDLLVSLQNKSTYLFRFVNQHGIPNRSEE